jgi:hypothetical protein
VYQARHTDELETRCVIPLYLKMMGLNALQHPVGYPSLAAVGQRTSDNEVIRVETDQEPRQHR